MANYQISKDYWIERVSVNVYAVKRSNGSYSITVMEGTYTECNNFIKSMEDD